MRRTLDDKDLLIELNFVEKQQLSKRGLLEELCVQMAIIEFCLNEAGNNKLSTDKMIDQMLSIPLRKLLCEDKSILKLLNPNFRMPELKGSEITIGNMHMLGLPLQAGKLKPLEDWLEQDIAWLESPRIFGAKCITKECFEGIQNALGRNLKPILDSIYQKESVFCEGETLEVYKLVNSIKEDEKKKLYQIIEKSGYANLTVLRFLKTIADKRGAHTDQNYPGIIEVLNSKGFQGKTLVQWVATELLISIKQQIKF